MLMKEIYSIGCETHKETIAVASAEMGVLERVKYFVGHFDRCKCGWCCASTTQADTQGMLQPESRVRSPLDGL